MQKLIPVLKMVLIACIIFLGTVIVIGLVAGAERPFAMLYPLLMGVLAFGLLSVSSWATPKCPKCDAPQPAIRKPTSFRQFAWGGWTCRECGAEIDRNGSAIDKPAAL